MFIFTLADLAGVVLATKILLKLMSKCVLTYFLLGTFCLFVSGLTVKSLVHLQSIFVYDVRKLSSFFFFFSLHISPVFPTCLFKRLSFPHIILLPLLW